MNQYILALLCLLLTTPALAGGDNYELGTVLASAKELNPPKSKFKKALFQEFIRYSEIEYREGDYQDSDSYALKAIEATSNNRVKLSNPMFFSLSDADKSEYVNIRQRLEKVLPKARRIDSTLAAKAVTLYECALLEAEEAPRQCEAGLLVILDKFEK